MSLRLEGNSAWCCLLSFIDLFDERVDGFAGLNRNVLILLNQVGIKFAEQSNVVFCRNEIPLKYLQDGDLVLDIDLRLCERNEQITDQSFLKCVNLLRARCIVLWLWIFELFEVLFELGKGHRRNRGTYIS